MNFRTTWDIAPFETQLSHGDKIVLMGSCFSENIGAKLRYFGFDAMVNPFGTIFHPMALANLLDPKSFDTIRPVERAEFFYTYETHSDIHGLDEDSMLEMLFARQAIMKSYLSEARLLVITFGSAWGYYLENEIVANCHKMPGLLFEKRLTKLDEMISRWQVLVNDLKIKYPKLNIVFTVSPVRHTKDGIIENQHSKSRLIELVHQLDALYFPSYEIQMDDLRDYRFYEADLIHPNATAVDYIFEKFAAVAIAEEARSYFPAIHKFRMFEAHQIKPWNEHRYEKHEKEIETKKIELLKQIPNISLSGCFS
jgi:hypothetical protein